MRITYILVFMALASSVHASESELYGVIIDSQSRPVMAELKATSVQNPGKPKTACSDKHGVYTVKLDHPGEWKLEIGTHAEIVQSYANPTRWDIRLK